MTLIGYARVSSVGQSLEAQEEALKGAGCLRVFSEKKSGKRASDREALALALDFIRDGDILVVTRLDRLARSVVDLHRIVERIIAKGADLRVLQQSGVDTSTSSGKLTLAILAAVAEFETDIRAERQREGIELAKAKGVYKKRRARGNSTKFDRKDILAALAADPSPARVAKKFGIARSTVYRVRDEAAQGAAE